MSVLGWEMIITDGLRSVEQQAALYAKGRTTPGSVVTNCDGVIKRSNHQAHPDGFGHAVDCAFRIKNTISWSLSLPFRLYGEMGKALGLKWGGDFSTIRDLPHLELP